MKVWINGCFDILHYAHYKIIKHASSLGSLVVGIDSDLRIKQNKGENRPYHNQKQRKFNLSCIEGVKKVVVFNNDEELKNYIKKEKPDIMVIGSEYRDKKIIGSEFIKKIIYFKKIKNFSTTRILKWKVSKS